MEISELQSIKKKYGIVGRSAELDRAVDTALQVAPTKVSVLIVGESGVGKEVVPRIIHDNSPRRHSRYMAINCGAVPEGLIDDELFGHVKGAFTGATTDRDGYFASVNGGTLFLDEVGELPPATQVRLLRVLETGEYLRLGSNEVCKTDVRIVAATNVKLRQAVSEGRFREDLYFRLNTIFIQMPPLRERGADASLIFRKIANDMSEEYNVPRVSLTPDAEAMLLRYRWPGNIRELRNLVQRLSILERERQISADILGKYITISEEEALPVMMKNAPHGQSDSNVDSGQMQLLMQAFYTLKRENEQLRSMLGLRADEPIPASSAVIPAVSSQSVAHDTSSVSVPVSNVPSISTASSMVSVGAQATSLDSDDDIVDVTDEHLTLAEMERRMIADALRNHQGRRKAAANELGISERTLYRKITEYGL